MHRFIRTAALELSGTNNAQVVKVAGIMRRLQNWIRALTNKDYAEEIDQIRFDSGAVQGTAVELNKRIESLLKAIQEGDVDEYNVALNSVRDLSNDLVQQLKTLNTEVQQPEIQPEETNVPNLENNKSVETTETIGSPKSPETITEISVPQNEQLIENYNREMWNDKNMREEIARATQDKIREIYPEHDVPISKQLNVPVDNFKWFKQYLPDKIHLKEGNQDGGRQNIINNTAKILERETKLSKIDAIKLLVSNKDEFFSKLKQAILQGKIMSYYPAIPEDPTKVKDREPIKFRKIGELHVAVHTAPFLVPEINVQISCVVGLTEAVLSRAEPKLILAWCNFGAVSTMGVPPEWKKAYLGESSTTPTPSTVVPVEIESTAPKTPEPKAPEPKTPKPLSKKKKKKTKAERLDLFKKLAGINPMAVNQLSDRFWTQFVQMCDRLGARPEDLARVIYSESGFDPHATNVQNGHVIAKGLNQLIKKTAHSLGMTDQQWDNFENYTAEAQLPFVEKYFHSVGQAAGISGNWSSAAQLYVANFAPKYIHRASNPDAVLYDANVNHLEYAQNKNLDRDKKGQITAGDLAKSVQKKIPPSIALAIQKAKINTVVTNKPIVQLDNMQQNNIPSEVPSNDVDSLINALYAEPECGIVEKIVRRSYLRDILPISDILISVSTLSSSLPVRIKFAKSLCFVLKEVCDAETCIHSKGEKIEIQCSVPGSMYATASAIRALCDCVSDAIQIKEQKNIQLNYSVTPGIHSKYAQLDLG